MVFFGPYLLGFVQILHPYPVYLLPMPGLVIQPTPPQPSMTGPAVPERVPDREQTYYLPRQWRASACQNGASG